MGTRGLSEVLSPKCAPDRLRRRRSDLDLVFKEEEPLTIPAVTATFGGYAWFNPHVGFDLEVSAGHLFETPAAQELLVAMGPVVHF